MFASFAQLQVSLVELKKKHCFLSYRKYLLIIPRKRRQSRYSIFFLVFVFAKKVEKERAFVIRAPRPSMERWPTESSVSHFRIRDQHRQQHSPQQHHSSFNRRRNNIFKRAKMKSLYDDKSTIFTSLYLECWIFMYNTLLSAYCLRRRISIIIVTAFVICWAPYYFMMITFIFLNPDDKVKVNFFFSFFF
jgi:hypothetical protein